MGEYGLKKTIRHELESNKAESVVSLAKENRKVLSHLVRIAYDKETLVAWRAIKAMGLAARELVETDPEFLRETCRKLLWSLSDESGGIGWAAPELLGELVSADPKQFADFIPPLASVYDAEEDVFRPGVLYALAKVGEKSPELAIRHAGIILKGLSEPNQLTRVFALRALQPLLPFLGGPFLDEVTKAVEKLTNDLAEAWVYGDDDFTSVAVGQSAAEVLALIHAAK